MNSFTIIALVFVSASVTIPTSPKLSEETTQRLPERNADWRTIRAKNLLYIDKTSYLVKLLQRPGKLWYVTRPRRFGKSSFIDMAADYFRGKEDMFEGLAVENVGNTKFLAKYMPLSSARKIFCKIGQFFCSDFSPFPKWIEFPVIHLNFGQIENFNTEKEFSTKYNDRLEDIARQYGLDPKTWSSFDLTCLIDGLRLKFNNLPVIILVDEYDHPFQYAFLELKKKNVARAVRTKLSGMFTTIKNHAEYLGLAFVTGVSKLLGSVALESTGTGAFVDLTTVNPRTNGMQCLHNSGEDHDNIVVFIH